MSTATETDTECGGNREHHRTAGRVDTGNSNGSSMLISQQHQGGWATLGGIRVPRLWEKGATPTSTPRITPRLNSTSRDKQHSPHGNLSGRSESHSLVSPGEKDSDNMKKGAPRQGSDYEVTHEEISKNPVNANHTASVSPRPPIFLSQKR